MKTEKDVEEINLKRVRLRMLEQASMNITHRNYVLTDENLTNFKTSVDKNSRAFQLLDEKDDELENTIYKWRKERNDRVEREFKGRVGRWIAEDETEPGYAYWYMRNRYDYFWQIALEYDLIPKE